MTSELPNNNSDQAPEITPIVSPVLAMQQAFADAALAQVPGEKLKRPQLEAILRAALCAIPEEYSVYVLKMMELRGVIPYENDGLRHVDDIPEQQQNVLRDPDGLLKQCARLAHGAQLIGRLLNLSEKEVQNLALAGMLVNSDKATLLAGLESDKVHCGHESFDLDRDIFMLDGYNEREHSGINLLYAYGAPMGVRSILCENIRHEPRKLKTLSGKILYFLFHSQMPNSNLLVPVVDRVNASMKDGMYRPLHAGYAKIHGNQDLAANYKEATKECEEEISAGLRAQGHTFLDLRTFVNEQLNPISPALQGLAQ